MTLNQNSILRSVYDGLPKLSASYEKEPSAVGNVSKNITIIDEGLSVEGDVTGSGEMIIRGTLKGTLSGERVTIAPGGAVYADVEAVVMTIAGECRGTLRISREVTITASGSCQGRLDCPDLIVEDGARLNAIISCGHPLPEHSPQPKTVRDRK